MKILNFAMIILSSLSMCTSNPNEASFNKINKETTSDIAIKSPKHIDIPAMKEKRKSYYWDEDINNTTIDIDLNWAILPQYANGRKFTEGLAAVQEKKDKDKDIYFQKKIVYIDGKPTVEKYKSQRLDPNAPWGYINKKGELVIPYQYEEALEFSEGLAAVKSYDKDGLFGYIDKTGKLIIPHKYKWVGYFKEGLAPVEINDEISYINKKGEVQFTIKGNIGRSPFQCSFSEGLAVIEMFDDNKKSYFIYIDKTGKEVIRIKGPDIDWASEFNEGLAAINLKGKSYSHSINKKNEVVFERKEDFGKFSEGLSLTYIKEGGHKYVYIDKTGKETIILENKIFTDNNFSEGIAMVSKRYEDVYYSDEERILLGEVFSGKEPVPDLMYNKGSLINTKGQFLMPYITYGYYEVRNSPVGLSYGFSESLAAFRVNSVGVGYVKSPMALNIKLNNVKLKFDRTLQLSEGIVLAPAKQLCRYLNIDLDNSTDVITLKKDNNVIKCSLDSRTININGKEKEYKVPFTLIFGELYVPLDIIEDFIGADTSWEDDTSTLTIHYKNKK